MARLAAFPIALALSQLACHGAASERGAEASAGIDAAGDTDNASSSGADASPPVTTADDDEPSADDDDASEAGGAPKFDLATMDVTPEVCDPPDVLFVLDRSVSMHKRPDGTAPPNTMAGRAETKWGLAVAAIEAATAEIEGIRFGLELFPRDPGGGVCRTVGQIINGNVPTNTQCQKSEIVAPPADDAAPIEALLDIDASKLCYSTPIAKAMVLTADELLISAPGRPRYAVLVSDGAESCDEAAVLPAANALVDAGIELFVVSFAPGDGIDAVQLNDLACAGGHALDAEQSCMDDGNGGMVAVDASGPPLFYTVEDGASLTAALAGIAAAICCGCTG